MRQITSWPRRGRGAGKGWWQVRAVLANGAVTTFGVEAASRDEAVLAADSWLGRFPQPATSVMITLTSPPRLTRRRNVRPG